MRLEGILKMNSLVLLWKINGCMGVYELEKVIFVIWLLPVLNLPNGEYSDNMCSLMKCVLIPKILKIALILFTYKNNCSLLFYFSINWE